MATLTTEGPNTLNLEERASCVLTVPDEVMIGVEQALCEINGYQLEIQNPALADYVALPETIPNPDWKPVPTETIWNLDYDEEIPGSLRDLPNPEFASYVALPETIPNPDYVAPPAAMIPNPERPGQFAMRQIALFLTEQRSLFLQAVVKRIASSEAAQITVR